MHTCMVSSFYKFLVVYEYAYVIVCVFVVAGQFISCLFVLCMYVYTGGFFLVRCAHKCVPLASLNAFSLSSLQISLKACLYVCEHM